MHIDKDCPYREDAKKYREDFNGLTAKDIGQWQQIQIQGIKDRQIVKNLEEELERYKDTADPIEYVLQRIEGKK